MKNKKFIPGKTYIPVSGKVYDEEEINNGIEAAKDCWWTEGRWAKEFEKKFSKFLGIKYVNLVNSGSSANLISVASLTSKVFGARKLKAHDEFITTNVAFPTTVNPGLLYGLKPIFIDAKTTDLNIDVDQIEVNISKKTKLVMVAHTLGIPFDLDKIMYLKKKYGLWVIEDCCDGLGSKFDGKLLGTFGDIATFSFYPAHQMTMGEGGAVVTNNPQIHRAIRQFRDWGRDCWCGTGEDNTCGKRFSWKMGELPYGYDHKYIYSQIGFNLKLTDFQAAIGCAQIRKLSKFIKKRKENYEILKKIFGKYSEYFDLIKLDKKQDPCWFGFPIVVKEKAPLSRNDIAKFFEENKIGTRNVFSGNLLAHPAYIPLRKKFKIVGDMKNADLIMNQAFWIGVWPGIGKEEIEYIEKILDKFVARCV